MQLYRFKNKETGKEYYGISKNAIKRRYSHVASAKRGIKTPFYSAVRKHGWSGFDFEILYCDLSEEEASCLEIRMIAESKEKGQSYNLHLGGHIGFDVNTKTEIEVNEWKSKLSKARQGRQPALGMTHTEDNKKVFSESGKRRWDMYGRYPDDVISLSFTEANKKYGISKTHYYRLRKARALCNEQS